RGHPRGRSLAPRLHGQRDGGAPALARAGGPLRWARGPRPHPAAHPVAPAQSFSDDPLRMMRAVRFVAQLGFFIEDATADAIEQLAERITIVSAERVREELVKLMLGAHPRGGLELMTELGLAAHVLPELPALQL